MALWFLNIIFSFLGKLLGGLLAGITDSSLTVCKSYAKAIGYVIKVCACTLIMYYTCLRTCTYTCR